MEGIFLLENARNMNFHPLLISHNEPNTHTKPDHRAHEMHC